ncbi:MAG: hypothetical protein I3270_00960 [Candidatus Moeniiplasma glomeromycotorum]|nr:hypothetical protein [Candidatus Moeniiplasma glomeromycotorum]MCE8162282.1 hypothetical protein [Candidatus Moeniiplasma glomeromycotorum]MCE8166207.1 hypothetical protein [Candidatus Moeniiplasma glomeromycotorum]MCE8166688.1 hypothetical protein [Candidatus Moeniiplasma glomeromycotorum]
MKDQQLAELNRQIRDKEAEIKRTKEKKQTNQPTNSNPNNNSGLTKLAIGLSIVAIIIGIVVLLVWIVKPRKS